MPDNTVKDRMRSAEPSKDSINRAPMAPPATGRSDSDGGASNRMGRNHPSHVYTGGEPARSARCA